MGSSRMSSVVSEVVFAVAVVKVEDSSAYFLLILNSFTFVEGGAESVMVRVAIRTVVEVVVGEMHAIVVRQHAYLVRLLKLYH
ncbi:hypothetical protein Tco_1444501 [Tanacetum coccineum]